MEQIIGGIEGGATYSTLLLLDAEGQVLSETTGPGTNHFLLGMTECRNRIATMVNNAKNDLQIPETTPLTALGLSLSGCELEETNQELVRGLLEFYPNLSERYAIGSDTEGSVAATSRSGGVTCIAGTGSNTLLINPDGSRAQCGGWGYLLGDEGSAYKIALRAVKACFDDLDGFSPAPHPIQRVWSTVQEHFNVDCKESILQHFYTKFDKPFIASIAKKLANCANDGDKLSQLFFHEAGTDLAQALSAVIPKASPELTNREGGIHILCVGSVWLSWALLKPGFISYLMDNTNIEDMTLMRMTATMAIGAAYMAADKFRRRDY
ncbi:BadF/BadG/BcrA/BcrD ATPase family [Popillia japonica]|uniref:N-acetyl-D-glucosamine kinase n=1 Tax=Popillia japonica TaxID=7064 RepID=A0AAW1KI49_POPJA